MKELPEKEVLAQLEEAYARATVAPYRVRFVFAYGVDDSDRPSYLLWPRRGDGGHFWLVDPWSGRFFDPAAVGFLAPIGLEHFFDAFALNHMRPLRVDAAAALHIPLEDVLDTLSQAS